MKPRISVYYYTFAFFAGSLFIHVNVSVILKIKEI